MRVSVGFDDPRAASFRHRRPPVFVKGVCGSDSDQSSKMKHDYDEG
jgi:hypothetical protein